jgi:hypothetical protein
MDIWKSSHRNFAPLLLVNLHILSNHIKATGFFMVTAGLAAVYSITTFDHRLSLQNKIKTMKAKMTYRIYRIPFSI